MDICLVGIFLFVVVIIITFVRTSQENSKREKMGFRTTWNGYTLDSKNKGDGTTDQAWGRMGYKWHDKWKKWVPDIANKQNENYWTTRGYY